MFITADDGLVKLIFSFPTLELSTMGIVEYCRLLLPKMFTFRNIFTFHYGLLTHLFAMHPFCTHRKHRESNGFLMFSGGSFGTNGSKFSKKRTRAIPVSFTSSLPITL